MLRMFSKLLLIVVVCVLGARADISGTDPTDGACLCVAGTGVNVRDTGCGNIIGQVNTGQCLVYTGQFLYCAIGATYYYFYEVNWGGSTGWIAGTYLNVGSASLCTVSSGACPSMVTRAGWGARPPTSISYISQPIPKVFVHHSEGAACTTQSACTPVIQGIQNYHMDSNGWSDIGYNYLVGEDGQAYEGRTWDRVGAHATDWNSEALGICVMGSFMTRLPNDAALQAVKDLISCAVDAGTVSPGYTLHGHRNGGCTDCPGDMLYAEIQTWPQFAGALPGSCDKE